jgi:phage shock protein PspC (stress-responsive transcriptional regulator)
MERVETININNIVFSIDENAFDKLTSYLDALERYFGNEQDGREIIADIEARIAELFSDRTGGNASVVTVADVTTVINTLGTPEDIAGTDAEFETPNAGDKEETFSPPLWKKNRHLYRDPDHRYLGGVCAGIAARLGVNPIIIRLLFIVTAWLYGFSILIYIFLWIIIPMAKTTAQKLEMRGEPVTVSNIEKNVRDAINTSYLEQSLRNFLTEAGELGGKVFGVIWRIFCFFLGLALFLTGVVIASLLFAQDVFFGRAVEWDFFSFNELLQHVLSPMAYNVSVTCTAVAVALVILACLFWGVKLMAKRKVKHKSIHLALFLIWIVVSITGTFACFSQIRKYTWNNGIVENKQIKTCNTLYLSASTQMKISNNPLDIYYDKENGTFYGKPNLRIYKSDDKNIRLKIEKESQGESKYAAYRYAEDISYNVEIRDSLLVFPSYFAVGPQNKWKFQTLSCVLYVPEGTVIVADETFYQDRSLGRRLRYLAGNRQWVMTDNKGLQPLE